MTAQQILNDKKIDSSVPILFIKRETALENLMETLEEYKIDFNLSELSKEELETLFSNYADCIIEFHPEDYHQERGAFWRTRNILMKYGLPSDEIMRAFDFT